MHTAERQCAPHPRKLPKTGIYSSGSSHRYIYPDASALKAKLRQRDRHSNSGALLCRYSVPLRMELFRRQQVASSGRLACGRCAKGAMLHPHLGVSLTLLRGGPMKRSLIWCLLGSVCLVSAAWSQASKSGGTEQAVVALEHKWLQSQQTNNTDLLAPLLADNFVETTSEGKVTTSKADALADAKSIKWSSVEYNDLKVVVFGDTAIAIGSFKGKGTDASGKSLDENDRFTDTWMKMPNGKWQCIASQDSPIKK
jgi:ketosteroid isomerase-like protein